MIQTSDGGYAVSLVYCDIEKSAVLCDIKLNHSLRGAVVGQSYGSAVADEYVLTGNAALLRCAVPSFVADFVAVQGWLVQDGYDAATMELPLTRVYGTCICSAAVVLFVDFRSLRFPVVFSFGIRLKNLALGSNIFYVK